MTELSYHRFSGHTPGSTSYNSTRLSAPALIAMTGLAMLIAIVQPILAQQPDNQKIAAEFFRNREYHRAVLLYEKFYNDNKSYSNYYYYFQCLIELKDYKTAEKIAKEQIRINRNALRYEVDLGFVYISSGDLVRGKKQFDEVIKNLTPNRGEIIEVANAFLMRRENDYAIKVYEKGKVMLKGSYGFHIELGDLYERNGNFEGMVKEYLELLSIDASQMNVVQNRLQNALARDTEGGRAELLRTAILRNIRNQPDVLAYSELMIWFSIQHLDFESALNQAIALDKRLMENGSRVFQIAQLSSNNAQYDAAIKAYQYLVNQGPANYYYLASRIEMLNVEYLRLTSGKKATIEEFRALENRYKQLLNEVGKSKLTLTLIRNLAHFQAFDLYEPENGIALLNETLTMPGINLKEQAECKLELADIMLYSGDVWEATLLYSQIEKSFPNEPIGHEAKFRNARLSYFIGEFEWARAQLDVLKAATSKLIANDAMALSLLIRDNMDPDSTYGILRHFANAEFNHYRNRNNLAIASLDSILRFVPFHPIADDAMMKKAEILIQQNEYQQASVLLKDVYEKFPEGLLADKAMFMLAEVNDKYLKNKEEALDLYLNLMLKYPGSLYAAPARKRYRELRGDVI